MVHFVGAGPGAPDLITVRGKQYLEEADVVIYAGSLVNPKLLEYTKDICTIYNSAKMTLEEVIHVIEKAEAEGKTTVRLHTGDPCIYGAIREQMDILDEKNIAYDYCPGDGVQQALQIGEDAVGLYLVVHDDDEHHDGPGRLGVQVCRGAPQAHHTDQVAADAACEDRTHQRDELIEVPAHVVVDELVQPFHDELGGGLPFGDVFQFEVTPQPEGQSREQRHDDPCAHKSLGDLEVAQHRDIGIDGIQDLCAVQFHLLRFTPFFIGCGLLRVGRFGVVLHRDVHRLCLRRERFVLARYLQVINGDTGEKQRQHTGKGLEAGGRDGHHHPQRLQQHPAVVGKL